ncbi:hypothetical protein [Nostoc punctiforme]|nr:hypothetical protein [Nostoc punctiforme]RCJ41116.1 hypothetical protein A6769_38850 [Nostoc punctiforme NIES-2108]
MDNVMELHGLQPMADKDKDRFQMTITLSEKAYEEFQAVAEWKKIPMATLLRQILEREHESPAFANLHKRTKQDD